MNDDLFDRLKKETNEKRGPWKKNGPKLPPKRQICKVRRKKTADCDTESAVQRECVTYLRLLGVPVNRQNAGQIHMGTFTMKLAEEGAGDLVSIMPDGSGRHLEIECKRRDGTGRQSPKQKEYQEKVEKWGGIYLLVTSKEELKEKLELVSQRMW